MTRQRQISSAPTTNIIEKHPLVFYSINEAHSNDKVDEKVIDTKSNRIYSNMIGKNGMGCPERYAGQLPNEIVCLIVSYLSQEQATLYACTLVNKQFYAITNPLLWKTPTTKKNTHFTKRFVASLSDISKQRLSMIVPHICKLWLGYPYWIDTHFRRIVPHLSHLRHLSICEGANITDTSFQHLTYHSQQLTSIRLVETQLTQISFSMIGQYCRQLKHVDWFLSDTQSIDWLELLLPCCPLESLEICSYHSSLNQHIISILKKFDCLTTLMITILDTASIRNVLHLATPPPFPVSNNTTTISECIWWPLLTFLRLNHCSDIDDALLIGFIKSRPNLERIYLENANQLTNRSLDAMVLWLPKLTWFTLTNNRHITLPGLRRLVLGCHDLAFVSMVGCRNVMGNAFPVTALDEEEDDRVEEILELDRLDIERIRQGKG